MNTHSPVSPSGPTAPDFLDVPRGSDGHPVPPNIPPRPVPRRRENAIQPPALTTSLSGLRFQGGGGGVGVGGIGPGYIPTPTTMASPYMMTGFASPMSAHPAPYNPQEWGPIATNTMSPTIGIGVMTPITTPMSAVSRGMPDESAFPAPPPPPPYSPPRSGFQGQSPHTSTSPAHATASQNYHQPTQLGGGSSPHQYTRAVSATSAPTATVPTPTSRPRPSSMIYGGDHAAAYHQYYQHQHQAASNSQPQVHGSSFASSSRSVYASPQSSGSNVLSSSRVSPDVHNNYYSSSLGPTPPGSRRAQSTGDLESRGGAYASPRRWQPGMPLPPPPPGPPPVSASPSSQRSSVERRTVTGRQPAALGTTLPTIPPTPAGWVDTDISTQNTQNNGHSAPNTTTAAAATVATTTGIPALADGSYDNNHNSSNNAAPSSQSVNSDGGSENSSNRTIGGKGIRERRIETRLGRSDNNAQYDDQDAPTDQSDTSSWPADLVLSSPGGTGLVRRRTVKQTTPRSARGNPSPSDELRTGSSSSTSTIMSPFGALISSSTASFPTPRQQQQAPLADRDNSRSPILTPPFSPGSEQQQFRPPSAKRRSASRSNIPPKELPTPPLNSVEHDAAMPAGLSVPSQSPASSERPISHLLHLPTDDSATQPPLVPRKPSIVRRQTAPAITQDSESFLRVAEERYRDFLIRESEAASDSDALGIFCDFLVSESAIRRQRYGSVWSSGSVDVERLLSPLLELFKIAKEGEDQEAPKDEEVQPEEQGQWKAPVNNNNNNEAENRPQPLVLQSPQPVSPSPSRPHLPTLKCHPSVEPNSWNHYRPTLSPIASMSMSNDERSSRGRAPSRWWESQTGSDYGSNGEQGNKRSKRETKYMGLPREMREAMQLDISEGGVGIIPEHDDSSFPPTNPFAHYGPNEYPPEKVGWHEDGTLVRAPSNSGREKLDISRLITMPPPYPRHYPAVNNNHPDLSFYRSTVRSVSDLSELKSTKQSYECKVAELREKYEKRMYDERRVFRAGMNAGIQEGSISYAEAADAETTRRSQEHDQERELVQAEYDLYQEEVFGPMGSILSDRINIASTGIDELRGKLFDSAQHATPNQTQEGGDEQPELLEKLTQLKWLFEARETLYREQFNLLSERNERYKKLVTLPYHQTKNRDKLQDTDKFFAQDSQDRRVAFAADTLRRFESFLAVVEDNVARGVEIQLSAFWDIAPSILDLLQRVPENLRGFAVRIPQKEFDENPSYYRFPLQYLYSLVSHAEKSTYQFIESQTNLFCLLHEVKSGLMHANCVHMELQRLRSGEDVGYVRDEMRESREEEERVLTTDLKDKVGMVEEQWAAALGNVLEDVKRRVQEWLEREGGWEEMVQMEQA